MQWAPPFLLATNENLLGSVGGGHGHDKILVQAFLMSEAHVLVKVSNLGQTIVIKLHEPAQKLITQSSFAWKRAASNGIRSGDTEKIIGFSELSINP